jgi:hypothetical protein
MKKKEIKTKRRVNDQQANTIDLYNTQLNTIEKTNAKEIIDINKKISKLTTRIQKKSLNPLYPEEIEQLKRELKTLTEKKERIESEDDLSEYLLKTAWIMKKKTKIKREKNSNINNDDVIAPHNKDSNERIDINDFIIQEKSNEKQKIHNEFLNATQGIVTDDYNRDGISMDQFTCNECKSKDIMYDNVNATITCTSCGITNNWQDPITTKEWVQTVNFVKRYKYKKTTYFAEYLNRFQAKEKVTISVELLQNVVNQLRMQRMSIDSVTPLIIKKILKTLKLNNYYDHVNTIIYKLTNKKPPQLEYEIEYELKSMFAQMQEPFVKYKHLITNSKHGERSNFLSYPYVVRKLLEILSNRYQNKELLDMSKLFKLPKKNERIYEQDRVMIKICEDLKWPFYKTIRPKHEDLYIYSPRV